MTALLTAVKNYPLLQPLYAKSLDDNPPAKPIEYI